MQVQAAGISMAYEEQGSGRPLLFIHGFPLNRRMWAPQLEGLSGSARVIAPDLRGHGESQAVAGPYTMEALAQDLNAFLDEIGASEPVVVCGLSMGGYVAMAMVREYPERTAGLILAATRAGPDSETARQNRDKSTQLAQEKGVTAVVEGMLPKMLSPETIRQRPDLVHDARRIMETTSLEGVVGALQGMKVRADSNPTLRQVRVPTLILHGEDDQLIPTTDAKEMQAALEDVRVEILPEAGHLLNLEQPELFNEAVKRFLERL